MKPETRCQIFFLSEMSDPVGRSRCHWQFRNRLKRIVKRRWNYLVNLFNATRGTKGEGRVKTLTLKPGDIVRVMSRDKIRATLNHWNQLKGCSFMVEMESYCNTTQRVFKRVDQFLDERDYHVKTCHGIVLLEGVICEGTRDFGPCDRSCFFFWREEWLEEVDPPFRPFDGNG